MTKTSDTVEKSAFLINQERIMALRAQQDKDIAERQKYTLVPAVQEAPVIDPNKTVITRQNLETGETTRRVVEAVPTPAQRFIKPVPLTLDEIRKQLVNAGNVIDRAKDQYQSDVESLDAFYAEANALRIQIAELQSMIAEKQARLTEIESEGSPKDKFLATIVKSEIEVAGLAGSLLETLSERAAQRIFGIPLAELSPDGKKDASGRYRKVFQRFTSGFYQRLGRTSKTATVEQVDKRSDDLLSDVSELIEYIGQPNN
jgi:hypothetical protein